MNLNHYLQPHGITLCAALPMSAAKVRKPHLLTRAGFSPDEHSSLWLEIFAIPYLTPAADAPERNLSSYAVSRDYHLFARELAQDLSPKLTSDFPNHRFAFYADHSPIDEVDAAVRAGLGVLGENRLLLTERYSSYVFLAEIVTDLPLTTAPHTPREIVHCDSCGTCRAKCPVDLECDRCLSALTQKRSPLTGDEEQTLRGLACAWGCDICQSYCPYTRRAKAQGTIYTDIPFFHRDAILELTPEMLDAMSDQEFAARAYAWRGKETIRRNLMLQRAALSKPNKEV